MVLLGCSILCMNYRILKGSYNLFVKIEAFSRHFTQDDSVVVFDVSSDNIKNMAMQYIETSL